MQCFVPCYLHRAWSALLLLSRLVLVSAAVSQGYLHAEWSKLCSVSRFFSQGWFCFRSSVSFCSSGCVLPSRYNNNEVNYYGFIPVANEARNNNHWSIWRNVSGTFVWPKVIGYLLPSPKPSNYHFSSFNWYISRNKKNQN
jgi:hypothetical protein